MAVTLRQARPQDEEFLFKVYASTRTDELALVPWSDSQREAFLRMQFSAQHSYYHDRFAEADYQVIELNGRPVGRFYVLRDSSVFKILDMALLPAHRNAGIGTMLLREIMTEAEGPGRAVQIYVETYNPSLRLFERLGFSRLAEEGANFLMEWRPASQSSEQTSVAGET